MALINSSDISIEDLYTVNIGRSFGNIVVGGYHQHHNVAAIDYRELETSSLRDGLMQFYTLKRDLLQPIEGLTTRPYLLEGYYVDLNFQEIYRTGARSTPANTIPINEMFMNRKGSYGQPTTRVLVMGEAGYGKSTLCKKLLQDWVEGSQYTSHFQIAILIRLKGVASTLEHAVTQLCNEAMGEKYEPEQILRSLKRLGNKLLLILDGYDEVSENTKPSIKNIIEYGESVNESLLKLATVLMTTNLENKFSKTDSVKKRSDGENIISKFCISFERILNINGLTREDQMSFINHYFEDDTAKSDSVKKCMLAKDMTLHLACSPLLLKVMCYVHKQGMEVNATEEFWQQYLKVVFKRAINRHRQVAGSFNVSEHDFDTIVLQLGEIFFQHLIRNKLVIEEWEIQEMFSEKAPFVISCGVLQKAFYFKEEDSKIFETPHKTLMVYLSQKYLSDALKKAEENERLSGKSPSNLLNPRAIKGLKCTMSTSLLSVEVQFHVRFSIEFVIEEVGPTSAPFLRLNPVNPLVASEENCFYFLRFSYFNRGERVSELLNSFTSLIYPKHDGIHRFKKLLDLLVPPELTQDLLLFKFWFSNACSDEFCAAMHTLSHTRLKDVELDCSHSEHSYQAVFERTECKVEQICSTLLSTPRAKVNCNIFHSLREDQLKEFLLKEYRGMFLLDLTYCVNETHTKFFKDNESNLETSRLESFAGNKVVRVLRQGKTEFFMQKMDRMESRHNTRKERSWNPCAIQ